MIIIIYSPGRNDYADLNTNAAYLQVKFPLHQLIDFSQLTDATDSQTVLYIMAHGNPKEMGGLTAKKLAKTIAKYIIAVHQKHHVLIKEIVLASCNTGVEWEGHAFFAAAFADYLSRYAIPGDITITAPNGMVVYHVNGDMDVIADKNPFVVDRLLTKALEKIDIQNPTKAKADLKPLLAPVPYLYCTSEAIFSRILNGNKEIVVDEASGHTETITVSETSDRFYVSNYTYNRLTNLFAKNETKLHSNPKNENFYGFGSKAQSSN